MFSSQEFPTKPKENKMWWWLGMLALSMTIVVHARHTSNFALIVDTSMNYFNYRHISNSLAFYRAVKASGIPDSNIILMLAEDIACNARNPFKSCVFHEDSRKIDLFEEHVEVDYRGEEVSVENVLRIISGRHLPGTPASKMMNSNANSNVLMYFSGHGGDGFIKFRDTNTLSANDLADAVAQMKEKGRFSEMLFVVDTCQAATLFERFRTEDVVSIGSSTRGQSSYSYSHDYELGVPVVDRFTYFLLKFFETGGQGSRSLETLFQSFSSSKLHSTAEWRSTLKRPLHSVPVAHFFGAVLDVKEIFLTTSFDETNVTQRDEVGGIVLDAEEEAEFWNEENWGLPVSSLDV